MISIERFKQLEMEGGSPARLPVDANSNPTVYFEFAIADLNDDHGPRSRINAFSNAKRALHFQVEILAAAFGIEHATSVNRRAFPAVLEFCSKCGVVTPRILRKLNRVRNAMEHEYYFPTREETEDFVDVVELFLAATSQYIHNFPAEIELADYDDALNGIARGYASAKLEPGLGVIKIEASDLTCDNESVHSAAKLEREKLAKKIAENEKTAEVLILGDPDNVAYRIAAKSLRQDLSREISVNDPDYFDWTKLIIEIHTTW